MTRVFLDATTLIALGTVGELELLTTLAGDLVVLPRIHRELTTEPARTNLDRFITAHEVATDDPLVAAHLDQAKGVLGTSTLHGDVDLIAAVLAYTAEDRPIGIVSDDRRVRTTARGLGATVTGTIGIVVRAVDEGLPRQEARDLVDRIDAHGLHLTGRLRDHAYALIDQAGEGG